MEKPSIYIASPLGFSEAGSHFYRDFILKRLPEIGFDVLDPWSLSDPELYRKAFKMPYGLEQKECLAQINKLVGAVNEQAIRRCTMMLSVLDGPDVDSGTASEIGFAAALDKLVIGYRGDFRISADNFGSIVNLQVQHFIESSGGRIYHHWVDANIALGHWYNHFTNIPPPRAEDF